MRPVVSDCGPLHYLVLIEAVELLPPLFGLVLIPETVAIELSHPATPQAVRTWLDAAPTWLEQRPDVGATRVSRSQRGAGERAAIALARSVDARLLLIDDRAGDTEARSHGLQTTGTLGVLIRAAQLDLIDLATAFERLRRTSFRCRPDFLASLLAGHKSRD